MKGRGEAFAVVSLLMLASVPAFVVCAIFRLAAVFASSEDSAKDKTVVLTGGKMTKCLQLARLFNRRGWKVVVCETELYRYAGSRFSRAVDEFVIIPGISGNGKDYMDGLTEVVRKYGADLFVPVSSPASAYFSALAAESFPDKTAVFHLKPEQVRLLDDKHRFIELARGYGLTVPESYIFENREDLLNFSFTEGKQFILKKIDYDPVYRLDTRRLPHQDWQGRVSKIPIDEDNRWVLQEYIEGREVCVHTCTKDGKLDLYICCPSSPFQVNYRMIDEPEVEDWVRQFLKKLNATGQLSFDFIIDRKWQVMPIECNPRTHSAITLMDGQAETIQAYDLQSDLTETMKPTKDSGQTHWFYHELHRILTAETRSEVGRLWKRWLKSRDAVFSKTDPWPFWFNNHVSIPFQLISHVLAGRKWSHIDFNIGKIIVEGGD